ncbi:MAG: rhomboid family intramembrane serine protease [Arsenophonus sp. ER-QC15-MAG3]
MLISGINAVMVYFSWPLSNQYTKIWRLFTPTLLHFSLTHISLNLMLWWYLASKIECQINTKKLFIIFILSSFFTNYGQSFFSNSAFGGLSGVIFSLIGYVWLTSKCYPTIDIFITNKLMIFTILSLFIGYLNIFNINIANTAHTIGLIVGLLIGLLDKRRLSNNKKNDLYIIKNDIL